MNKYHIITLILCLFCRGGPATASPDRTAAAPDTQARSSQLKVSGIIKDDAGSPLIGVTIVVKGTSSGSVSNSDGSYTITVPYAEATLMVSYIGYAPQEINVNNRTRIDITMVEDSKALEEVVVVGYNVQKKETITGSISTITTKDLKQSPTANINNALAGRMPGLLVNQFNGGEPGNDAAQLNIRGKSTYGKSDVIMIVDGIERDMSYLSPDEIETFTILKDASATAPYGIRGANGVIIVTTKRGRKGEKPTVDFKASVGVSEPIRYPDYLGSADYATLYNEAMLNDNPSLDPGSASLFSQETISNFRRAKGDNSDGLGYNWDYFDYAFKPSILQDYSLSVRGGTDRARYFILGSYYNQGGNYKHSNSDNVNKFLRYNFRANVDVDATKRLKISVDLGARVTEYNYPGATAANIISLANTQPPYLPIILPNNHNDVNQADFEENGGYLLYADNDYRYNMLGQLNRTGFSKRTRRYLQGSFKLSQDLDFITKGLSVAAQFSYDTYNQHTINNSVPTHSTGNLTYPGYSTWMLPTEYSIDEWKNNADYWIKNGTYVTANQRTTDDAQSNSISHGSPEGTSRFQARLDYARKFGDHNVSGMLLFYLQNKVISNQVPYRYMGFSGRATYDYRNKYLFEFNIGYNGSPHSPPRPRRRAEPQGRLGGQCRRAHAAAQRQQRHNDHFQPRHQDIASVSVGDADIHDVAHHLGQRQLQHRLSGGAGDGKQHQQAVALGIGRQFFYHASSSSSVRFRPARSRNAVNCAFSSCVKPRSSRSFTWCSTVWKSSWNRWPSSVSARMRHRPSVALTVRYTSPFSSSRSTMPFTVLGLIIRWRSSVFWFTLSSASCRNISVRHCMGDTS